MIYEQPKHPLLGRLAFLRRVLSHTVVAVLLILIALGIGVSGYHWLAGLGWVDSLLNASMILGGMGPVDPLKSDAAKIFASLYALFSGLMFIGIASVVIASFLHRILHRFHLDDEGPP